MDDAIPSFASNFELRASAEFFIITFYCSDLNNPSQKHLIKNIAITRSNAETIALQMLQALKDNPRSSNGSH